MNLKAIWAFFDLFRKGNAVADPALIKHGQLSLTLVLPALAALVTFIRSLGYEIPLSDEQVASLAGGLVVLINLVGTLISSEKVGLPPKSADPAPAVGVLSAGHVPPQPLPPPPRVEPDRGPDPVGDRQHTEAPEPPPVTVI